ncbi:MAG: penicillin-binding protein 2 [Candidatus Kapabacteria bacterium]|nr:penicillin-binding protein 2 [Ignavibacteriota bacterium]MCW5884332.1 penicillin-binding protein 2 [Candidatus Kapabacteria bacterium]
MAYRSSFGDSPEFASGGRYKFSKYLVFAIILIFSARLAQLQIIEGDKYKSVSEAQAIKRVRIEPFRGNLYDRNNDLVVHNEASFSVTLTPANFNPAVMPLLSSILEMDSTEIQAEVKKYQTYSKFNPIKIYRDADFRIISLIEEYSDDLFGIDVVVEPKRLYEFSGNMAHLLGYTREISRQQLDKLPYYFPGDLIGQSGIERTYESDLRGREGVQYVAVNKFGQRVAGYNDGANDIPAKNGFDLYIGIDIKLQELAEKLLDGKRGSVVAINPKDGSVIAMASKPDYDPRSFSGKIPPGLFRDLSTDPASPLLHRAIMSQYPPGSTWKMLIALAGLQEGLISENSSIFCGGGLQYGGRFRKCHGAHGNTSVRNAIKTSCNVFFYTLGMRLGYEKFEKYGKMFGFGMKSGIDLPHENQGLLPTKSWLESRLGKGGASEGRLVNYGIGQGEILTTPLQIAAYVATIANEGTYNQPHIVTHIRNNITNKKEEINYRSEQLPIDNKFFKIIKNGMFDVVNVAGGTASIARLDDVDVCGKTGTAENPHGRDHSWFVAFAPKENPEIAICVFVENAGFGSQVAAPIAHKILDTHFHPDKYDEYMGFVKRRPKVDSTAIMIDSVLAVE